jgi:NAD(P)-dependent dehydrogenase (short-subunit alcohol dehydrogenase family)
VTRPDELHCFTPKSKEECDKNPVVLITGALTGIGRALRSPSLEGARVVVSGRREQEGKKLEKELRELAQKWNS